MYCFYCRTETKEHPAGCPESASTERGLAIRDWDEGWFDARAGYQPRSESEYYQLGYLRGEKAKEEGNPEGKVEEI